MWTLKTLRAPQECDLFNFDPVATVVCARAILFPWSFQHRFWTCHPCKSELLNLLLWGWTYCCNLAFTGSVHWIHFPSLVNLFPWPGREIHQDVFLGKDVFLGQGPQWLRAVARGVGWGAHRESMWNFWKMRWALFAALFCRCWNLKVFAMFARSKSSVEVWNCLAVRSFILYCQQIICICGAGR